ncbi:hypothetical protein L7F22_047291 [Adiantum nelumboides]|nr:hypothetical protein [Adiantum nelumboides]
MMEKVVVKDELQKIETLDEDNFLGRNALENCTSNYLQRHRATAIQHLLTMSEPKVLEVKDRFLDDPTIDMAKGDKAPPHAHASHTVEPQRAKGDVRAKDEKTEDAQWPNKDMEGASVEAKRPMEEKQIDDEASRPIEEAQKPMEEKPIDHEVSRPMEKAQKTMEETIEEKPIDDEASMPMEKAQKPMEETHNEDEKNKAKEGTDEMARTIEEGVDDEQHKTEAMDTNQAKIKQEERCEKEIELQRTTTMKTMQRMMKRTTKKMQRTMTTTTTTLLRASMDPCYL